MNSAPQHPTREEWLTVPNVITVARLLLIAPVCWWLITAAPGNPWPVIMLAVWASTDWVDGFLARRLGQTSRTGEILDPIADRLGTIAIVASLGFAGVAPWPALIAIVVTDIVTVVAASGAAARGDIHVTWLGKIRTTVLFVAIVMLVLGTTLVPWLVGAGVVALWVGTALHVLAGVQYVVAARRSRTR